MWMALGGLGSRGRLIMLRELNPHSPFAVERLTVEF